MGLSLKQFFSPNLFKPHRKTMSVRGDEFRMAQQSEEVQGFLEETMDREKKLKRRGLIHS